MKKTKKGWPFPFPEYCPSCGSRDPRLAATSTLGHFSCMNNFHSSKNRKIYAAAWERLRKHL